MNASQFSEELEDAAVAAAAASSQKEETLLNQSTASVASGSSHKASVVSRDHVIRASLSGTVSSPATAVPGKGAAAAAGGAHFDVSLAGTGSPRSAPPVASDAASCSESQSEYDGRYSGVVVV